MGQGYQGRIQSQVLVIGGGCLKGLEMLLADARRETGNLGGHHLHTGLGRIFQVNRALVKVSLLLASDSGELLNLDFNPLKLFSYRLRSTLRFIADAFAHFIRFQTVSFHLITEFT